MLIIIIIIAVVIDGLNSIFNSIYDHLNLGKSVTLKMGFCNIYFTDRNLHYSIAQNLTSGLNDKMAAQLKEIAS